MKLAHRHVRLLPGRQWGDASVTVVTNGVLLNAGFLGSPREAVHALPFQWAIHVRARYPDVGRDMPAIAFRLGPSPVSVRPAFEQGTRPCDRDYIAFLLVEAEGLLEHRVRLVRSADNAEDLRQIHQRLCMGGEEVALLHEGDRFAGQPLRRFGFASAREDFRLHGPADRSALNVDRAYCLACLPGEFLGLVVPALSVDGLCEPGGERREAALCPDSPEHPVSRP
jgi:hypothetical protein